jgi:GNAT superfamily N-acetyltransferase
MSLVFIEQAKLSNLAEIMTIINSSKKFLKESGSTQWQNGYPNDQDIKHDIEDGDGWILRVDGKTAGYAACIVGKDPTYQKIDGEWANDTDPYATIHRVAISGDYRGQRLSHQLMSNLLSVMRIEGIENFRIDTSFVNTRVQNLATKNGFEKRGIIWTNEPVDNERYAYELNLSKFE